MRSYDKLIIAREPSYNSINKSCYTLWQKKSGDLNNEKPKPKDKTRHKKQA